MGIFSGFIDGLRRPKLQGLGRLAQRQWRQAREAVAYADFAPGEIGPGALFPSLPSAEAAPEPLREALLEEAAEILRGKFSVFGGLVLNVHTPPIWYRDYLAGQEAPATARSSQLEATQLPGRMDLRLIWEVNRWTQVVRLAQAFFLTREDHFRETVIEWLQNWQQNNPVSCGWNWTSVTEAAVRLLNLTWIDALCALPEPLLQELLPTHGWWVQRYHEVGFADEEDPLGPICALICAAARWPQVQEWTQPLAALWAKLEQEITVQFDANGSWQNPSPHAAVQAWEWIWHAKQAGGARGLVLSAAAAAVCANATSLLPQLLRAREPWPQGDSDDGHLIPCYAREATAWEEWQAWAAGDTNALSYWWGFTPVLTAPSPPAHEQHLSKDDWELVWYLPEGDAAPHSHQDALHCSIWHGGLALMIDPGTGHYFGSPETRERLAGPSAHNGPHLLDAAKYPQRVGDFGWSRMRSQLQRNGNTATLLINGAELQRKISPLERGWRWEDESSQPFAVHWQLAPGWEIEPHDDYLLLFRDGHSLRLQISGATFAITATMCSPGYGQMVEATMIMARALAGGRIVTELTAERLL